MAAGGRRAYTWAVTRGFGKGTVSGRRAWWRASGRARLGLGILLLWAGTLAWHVKRQYFRPLEEVVALGARTLPPGAAYYAVQRDGRQVGWARSHLDTLPAGGGFLLEDRLEVFLPLGPERVTVLASEVELGPTLALRRFAVESRGALGRFSASGRASGDTLLLVRVEREGRADSLRLSLDGPVLPSYALAMRLVAGGGLRPGDRVRLPVFDLASLSTRQALVRVLEGGLRSFPDSATVDEAGRWVPARRDTVRAWLVEREAAGLRLRTWIDEDGRLVEAEMAGGLRLDRTAFELAYYPFRDEVAGRAGTPPDEEGGT